MKMKNAMTVRLLILCVLAYVITDTFVAHVANAIGPAIFNAVHPSNAVLFSAQIHAVVYVAMFVVVWYLLAKVYDALKKPRDSRERSDNDKQEPQAQEQSTKTSWAGMTKPILALVGVFAIGFALGATWAAPDPRVDRVKAYDECMRTFWIGESNFRSDEALNNRDKACHKATETD